VLFEKIKSGNYDADDPIWENISAQAKDIVAKLLTVRCLEWRCCGVLCVHVLVLQHTSGPLGGMLMREGPTFCLRCHGSCCAGWWIVVTGVP